MTHHSRCIALDRALASCFPMYRRLCSLSNSPASLCHCWRPCRPIGWGWVHPQVRSGGGRWLSDGRTEGSASERQRRHRDCFRWQTLLEGKHSGPPQACRASGAHTHTHRHKQRIRVPECTLQLENTRTSQRGKYKGGSNETPTLKPPRRAPACLARLPLRIRGMRAAGQHRSTTKAVAGSLVKGSQKVVKCGQSVTSYGHTYMPVAGRASSCECPACMHAWQPVQIAGKLTNNPGGLVPPPHDATHEK